MEELLNKIIKYINNKRVKYAIMIDGEWGCGKTYFIKNKLIKKYENAIYISLYGISSIEKLNEKIYYEIIKSKYSTSKIVRFFKNTWKKSIVFKILLCIPYFIIWIIKKIFIMLRGLFWLITYNIVNLKFNINISGLKKTDFSGAIELFNNINKYVLIFDDLERSNIPFNEVLGYISELVENRNTKCIIISNEREIEQINKNNYELKILTAIHMNKNNENNDIQTIKEQVKKIYDETNSYKRIKEKIIGKTYLFKANISEIYDSIILDYDDELKTILNDAKDEIMKKMDYLNYHNIRTLKDFFEIFDGLFTQINLEMSKYNDKKYLMYKEIVISTFCTCISYKKGEDIKQFLDGESTNYVSLNVNDSNISESFYFRAFDFIIEYIIKDEIIKSNRSKTLDDYYEIAYKNLLVNDPLNKLEQYWEKSELEITQILKDVNNNIKNKKYEYKMYSEVLFKISLLESIGYNNSIVKKIIENMKNNIKNDEIIELYSSPFFDKNEVKKIYDNYYNEIARIIEQNKKTKNINQNKAIMSNENWGIELYNYIKNSYNTNNVYVDLDVEKIVNNIKNSDNNNIYHFKYYLDKLSSISNYIDLDYKKLIKLEEQVKILYDCEKDIMKKHAIKVLLDKLDRMNNTGKMWDSLD